MVKAGGNKEKKKVKKDVAKVLNKGKFSNNVLAMSGYFQTLVDPFNCVGEKIPDFVNYPSSTFSLVYKQGYTLPASGNGSVAFGVLGNATNTSGSLVPVRWLNPVMGLTLFPLGMVNITGPTTTDLFPAATSTGFFLPQWTAAAGVPTVYSKARLVSAGFAIDYMGAALASKGTITIVSLPRNHFRSVVGAGPLSLNLVQNSPGARIIPINRLTGGSCVYHPVDTRSLEYVDLNLTYDNSSLTTFLSAEAALGAEVYVILQGATSGDQFQITAVLNYEGIPYSGALNLIQSTKSRADPIELSMTMNAIEDIPKAHEGTDAVQGIATGEHLQLPAASSPNHSSMTTTEASVSGDPEESPTFMEKLLGDAGSLSSAVNKGVQFANKFAPLAKTALSLL
jgi:hypothetical protein